MAPKTIKIGVVYDLTGPFAGTLTSRTFNNPPLEGPLAGQPFSALVSQIAAGNAYVNVHTSDNVAPPNTGPGDADTTQDWWSD